MEQIRKTLKDSRGKFLLVTFLVLIMLSGAIYGIYNFQKNNALKKEPTLEIYKPNDGQEVSGAQIVLEGKTNSSRNKVFVNGQNIAIDKKGNFATEISLKEGENIIFIEASNPYKKKITIERKIIRIIPSPVNAYKGSDYIYSNGKLNNSGPENFWLPETALLAAAATAFIGTKGELSRIRRKI